MFKTKSVKGEETRRRILETALGLFRTRGFDANRIVHEVGRLAADHHYPVQTLFLDCGGSELVRRFSATRRRHPLAPDRPATDGIAAERELMAPLRTFADQVIDTTDTDSNALRQTIRTRFGSSAAKLTLSVLSFGFANQAGADSMPLRSSTSFSSVYAPRSSVETSCAPTLRSRGGSLPSRP